MFYEIYEQDIHIEVNLKKLPKLQIQLLIQETTNKTFYLILLSFMKLSQLLLNVITQNDLMWQISICIS